MCAKSSNDGNNEDSSFFWILGFRDDRYTIARACRFSRDDRVRNGPLWMFGANSCLYEYKRGEKKKKEKRNGKTILSLAEYCSKYRTSNVLNVFLYYTHSVEFSNLGISHTRIKITRSVTPDARSPSEKP